MDVAVAELEAETPVKAQGGGVALLDLEVEPGRAALPSMSRERADDRRPQPAAPTGACGRDREQAAPLALDDAEPDGLPIGFERIGCPAVELRQHGASVRVDVRRVALLARGPGGEPVVGRRATDVDVGGTRPRAQDADR